MDLNTVVVALSGGLDSAAAALQLLDRGYRVLGVHFRVSDDPGGVAMAERNARWLGIPLTVLDLRERFGCSVIEYFTRELHRGRTPAPCSFCNPHFKWRELISYADSVGAHYLAMGHYVRQLQVGGEYLLRRGVDPAKDQSYYLWDLSQSVLSRALFPLGEMTKAQVREYLTERGYVEISRTKESMGLCFLPQGVSYRDFVSKHLLATGGDVVDLQGRVVGSHSGAVLYTIGQRRGFDIFEQFCSSGEIWVVVGLDTANNRIIVSTSGEDLYIDSFVLDQWRVSELAFENDELQIMVRGIGRNPSVGAHLTKLEDGGLVVTLLGDRAWAVASGQPVVIYRDDLLLGGGYVRGEGRV